MNKQVQFRHLKGTRKLIPGIPVVDCSPRLITKKIFNADFGGDLPTLVEDPNDVISIVLLNEDFMPLTEEEEALPDYVKDSIKKERTEDYFLRRKSNKAILDNLTLFEGQGEIKILGIKDLTPEEVLVTSSPIVSLSEIAIADHLARGIEVPDHLREHKDTERARAKQQIAAKAAKK